MVRPEGAGYAVAVALALLAGGATRKHGLRLLGVFVLLFAPWFLWRWQHFGFPLPNTAYVKSSPSSMQCYLGWRYLEECLTSHGYWLVLPALLVGLWRRKCDNLATLVAFVLAANVVNTTLVGGDIFAFYRFLLPAQVVGVVLLVYLVRLLVRRIGRGSRALRHGVVVVVCMTLGGWMLWAGWAPRYSLHGSTPDSYHARIQDVARMNEDYRAIGEWLARTFPPETVVALNAAGIVPYESQLPTIDMLGLNDTHIAHVATVDGEGAQGHQKHDAEYVLAQSPDVVLPGLPVLAPRRVQAAQLHRWFARWWEHLPGDRDLFASPRFQEQYVPYSIRFGTRGWLMFFVRRGSEPAL